MHELEDRTDTIMAQFLGHDMQAATVRLAVAVVIVSAVAAAIVVWVV